MAGVCGWSLPVFDLSGKVFDKKNVFPQKLPAVQTVQRPTKGLQQNKNLNYLARMVPWRLVRSSLWLFDLTDWSVAETGERMKNDNSTVETVISFKGG